MRVFLVGNTTVEHAMLWRLSASRRISGLYCASPGPARLGLAELLDGGRMRAEELAAACRAHGVDLAVLSSGNGTPPELACAFTEAGITVLAPDEKVRQIETTRAFMLSFAEQYGIPVVRGRVFTYLPEARRVLSREPGRHVLKKSMPTSHLDVIDSDKLEEQLAFAERVLETDSLVLEPPPEAPELPELSVFALTDGTSPRVFPTCERHDRSSRRRPVGFPRSAGAVAPVPWADTALTKRIERDIVGKTIEALESAAFRYRGIIGFQLRLSAEGPLIDHVRFGLSQPEASVLMPLLDIDFGTLLEAVLERKLDSVPFGVRHGSTMAVVLTNDTDLPLPLTSSMVAVPGSAARDTIVFLAEQEGRARSLTVPPGGTLTAVGIGRDALRARDRAMRLAGELSESGFSFSREVGQNLFR
ncbi:MAG: hypothetical protein ACLFNX_01960 [Spirochaetaceae bacterium]